MHKDISCPMSPHLKQTDPSLGQESCPIEHCSPTCSKLAHIKQRFLGGFASSCSQELSQEESVIESASSGGSKYLAGRRSFFRTMLFHVSPDSSRFIFLSSLYFPPSSTIITVSFTLEPQRSDQLLQAKIRQASSSFFKLRSAETIRPILDPGDNAFSNRFNVRSSFWSFVAAVANSSVTVLVFSEIGSAKVSDRFMLGSNFIGLMGFISETPNTVTTSLFQNTN